jgi:hypothetical protein
LGWGAAASARPVWLLPTGARSSRKSCSTFGGAALTLATGLLSIGKDSSGTRFLFFFFTAFTTAGRTDGEDPTEKSIGGGGAATDGAANDK